MANIDTPFGQHGALSVRGNQLVDAQGKPYQLYGMSTHGIGEFSQFVSAETFDTLRYDWKTNAVRLAMYTDEAYGYCTTGDKAKLKQLVRDGVRFATELGMYVIVDWHILFDETPLKYADLAADFFAEMSAELKDHANVIYEICNEPNKSGTWADVTAYAKRIIPIIRKNAPNSVIIVGTPTWSQDIHLALAEPLPFNNLMYTLHFYAATHTDYLRQRARDCIGAGLPVFISEFGICDASGNGDLDYYQADQWKALIEEHGLSCFCWNLANKNESSSIVRAECTKLGNWTEEELNPQGVWIRNWYRSK